MSTGKNDQRLYSRVELQTNWQADVEFLYFPVDIIIEGSLHDEVIPYNNFVHMSHFDYSRPIKTYLYIINYNIASRQKSGDSKWQRTVGRQPLFDINYYANL